MATWHEFAGATFPDFALTEGAASYTAAAPSVFHSAILHFSESNSLYLTNRSLQMWSGAATAK
jgi:hypothetical protein